MSSGDSWSGGVTSTTDSTSITLRSNSAWCAVSARPDSEMMFGIESGSQRVLDRLKKEQTLAEVEIAVRNAKQAVVRGLDLPLTEGLELEKRLSSELRLATGKATKIKKGRK